MAEDLENNQDPQPKQPYSKAVYDDMANKYGANNIIPYNEFDKKISSDKVYAKQVHDDMSSRYGKDNIIGFDDFLNNVKKKDTVPPVGTTSKDISQLSAVGGVSAPQSPSQLPLPEGTKHHDSGEDWVYKKGKWVNVYAQDGLSTIGDIASDDLSKSFSQKAVKELQEKNNKPKSTSSPSQLPSVNPDSFLGDAIKAGQRMGTEQYQPIVAPNQRAVSGSTSNPNINKQRDLVEKVIPVANVKKAEVDKAIDEMAVKRVDSKKLPQTKDVVNTEKDFVRRMVQDGDLVYDNGKLKRGTGFFGSLYNSIEDSHKQNLDNNFMVSLPKDKAIEHLNARVEDPSAFHPEEETVHSGMGGEFGKMIGENLGGLVKGIGGGIIGGALAPETGGASFGTFLATVKDFTNAGYAQTLEKNYTALKKQDPYISDSEAYDKAHQSALVGGAIALGTNALLSHSIVPKTPIPTMPVKGVMDAFERAASHAIGSSPKVLGSAAAGSLINDATAKAIGVDVKGEDVGKNVSSAVTSMGIMHFGMAAMAATPEMLAQIPSYLRPQLENVVASAPRQEVADFYNKAEEAGIMPQGTTANVLGKLAAFDKAKATLAPFAITEEKRAAIAGKLLEKEKLTAKLAEVDAKAMPTAAAELQTQVDGINEQVDAMYKAKDVFSKEVDKGTGETAEPLKPTTVVMPKSIDEVGGAEIKPKEEVSVPSEDKVVGSGVGGDVEIKYGGKDKDLKGNPQKQWMKPTETSEQATNRLAEFVEASDSKGREQSAFIDRKGESGEVKLRNDEGNWNWYDLKSKKPFASFDTAKDAIEFIQEQPFWDNGELNKNGRNDAYFAKVKADHIKTGLENGNIIEDINDGKISKQDAKAIIENAGLKVPKEIQSLPTPPKADVVGSGEEVGVKGNGDIDIEKRMAELEGAKTGTPERAEFNALEKEMEKRERDSIFSAPLDKVGDVVNNLMDKEKNMPNGFGSFIEKRDARETKEAASRYLSANKLTNEELHEDFKDALFGNPTTWHADGLKLRESVNEAAKRGIKIDDLLKTVEDQFTKEGFDEETARETIAGMLKPVFEGSQKVETEQSKQLPNETQSTQKPVGKSNEGSPTSNESKPTETQSDSAATIDKTKPTASEGTGSKEPPKPPIEESKGKDGGSGNEAQGLITKEELSKHEQAKKLFESEGKTTWNEIVDKAVTNLIKDNPKLPVEAAAQSHVDNLAAQYDANKGINPTAEDLAVINLAKLDIEKKLSDPIFDINSNDVYERDLAIKELTNLNDRLLKVAKAANPREAGLAFSIRQMLLSMKDGLQIKRMELTKQKGEKLSKTEMDATREEWIKEKRLMEEKADLEKKAITEKFEAELKTQADKLAKLMEDKANVEVSASKAKQRQSVLKEKGKDFADKIRRGIQKGAMADPFLVGKSLNFIIEKVADLVEKGYTLAAAIDEFATTNKINNRRRAIEDAIFDHINRQDKRDISIQKIQEAIDNDDIKTITKDLVQSNTIKDFVDSYVNTVELKTVGDVAFKKLKELLPSITKEQFKEAYLKRGEFKIETEKELKNLSQLEQRKFAQLTDLEKRLGELKKKKDLLKDSEVSSKEKLDDAIVKAKDAISKELVATGKKISNASAKYKETIAARSESHNNNIKEVSTEIDALKKGADDKTIQLLDDLKSKLELSKVEYEPLSKSDQTPKLKEALDKIDLAEKQLTSIKKQLDRDTYYDLENSVQKIKDRFNEAKEEATQEVLLDNAKKNTLARAKEYERKINAKEFDQTVNKSALTRTDAEIVQNEKKLAIVKSAYDKRAEQFRKKNRKGWEVGLEATKNVAVNVLIGAPKTFFKLAVASPAKIMQTYLSKGTFGKLFELIGNKGFVSAAKSGGESSSNQAMNRGLSAVFTHKNSEELSKKSDAEAIAYTDSASKYEDAKAETKVILESKGKGKEYEEALKKEEKLKQESEYKLKVSIGNTIEQYIGGSTLKTMQDKLVKRNTQYENMMGHFNTEEWTEMNFGGVSDLLKADTYRNAADNISYLFGFVGRSHGALKSISARYHFATGFMGRIEAALEKGEDISDFGKLQQYAAESYTDWESGMYQQDNWITSRLNKVVNDLKTSDRRGERIIGNLVSWDVAITKVPVNQINEAIIDMTLGLPLSIAKYGKEYYKAKGIVTAELGKPLTATEKSHFKEVLSEQLSKVDKKTAATIARMFRHGGFGLGIMGVAVATGYIKYGGHPHAGQKKEDARKGEGALKTSEIEMGDTKLNKYVATALEHTTSMFPALSYLSMKHQYDKDMRKGKGNVKSVADATYKQLEYIINSYPQSKIFNPLKSTERSVDTYKGATQRLAEEYSFGLYKKPKK